MALKTIFGWYYRYHGFAELFLENPPDDAVETFEKVFEVILDVIDPIWWDPIERAEDLELTARFYGRRS